MALQTYAEVLAHLHKANRKHHLLLGNGFSMAYDPNIFSYTALHKFISESDDIVLAKLFDAIKTKNFELMMQQLATFVDLLKAFEPDSKLIKLFNETSDKLKTSLIDAIKALHPDHVFEIDSAKSQCCASFLNEYLGSKNYVFTTNYDVLLYWVLMRNKLINHRDGFGRDYGDSSDSKDELDTNASELRWGRNSVDQNTFYLHGALPLFDTGSEIIKEEYEPGVFIVEKIRQRINKGEYPVFVTAGNGAEKLEHITHNKYLANCYDKLAEITGSLVTFGFSFGEYDDHIIHALNRASKYGARSSECLRSIYIGVYNNSDEKRIESIRHKFTLKVNLFDAKTVPVWNQI